MANLNFALLGGPVNAIGEAMEGFETGQGQAQKRSLQNALSALSANPNDPEAMRVVQSISPRTAMALEDAAYQRQERQREGEFRNALTDLLLGRGGETAANGMMPTGAPAPSPGAAAAQPSAFRRAAMADPEKAISAQTDLAKMSNEQLKAFMDLNTAAFQMLGGVRDQATYEAGLARIQQMFGQFGLDLSGLNLPAEYSPEVVRELQMVAMNTKDQLGALRAERRLDWDIEDDQIDNTRADRNTDSMISTRQGQLANTRRGQDLTDARTRRGQDVASRDRRRGQDMSSRDRRDSASFQGRGGRGRGNAARIVNPQTGEAMVLQNGQWVPEK